MFIKFRNKPIPPPPLPPHAVPLTPKKTVNEDYRPPVPPHRIMPCTSTAESPVPPAVSTPKKYHHQRYVLIVT